MTVDEAIRQLAATAAINIVYERALVEGMQTDCRISNAPASEVLNCILEGTGVSATLLRSGTWVLNRTPRSPDPGAIQGRVLDESTREPLVGAHVRLTGTLTGAATDGGGRFRIENLPPGAYSIEVSMIGFEGREVGDIQVPAGGVADLSIPIAESDLRLSEVVVTPGYFRLMSRAPVVRQVLSQEEIRRVPHIADDAFRAVSRLPGLAANDLSAGFAVRGGSHEEVLVLLDGLELIAPYHVKNDYGGGMLSIIDTEAVGGIDLMTGAFPVEYGDRLSGVFSITSSQPPVARNRTAVGLSFTNLRFVSEGRFDEGDWLLIGRRGFVDLLLKAAGEADDYGFHYNDVFGRFRFRLNATNTLTANILRAEDDITFDSPEINDNDHGNWLDRSSYAWVSLASTPTHDLYVSTMASLGRIDGIKQAEFMVTGNALFASVDDERRFDFVGFKQDWLLERSDRLLFKWGFDLKRARAGYDYFNQRRVTTGFETGNRISRYDSTLVAANPSGNSSALYAGLRHRPIPALTLEGGLRMDYTSWVGETRVSPRLGVAAALSNRTTVRLGWGLFSQEHELHQLEVEDGHTTFLPAEKSRHHVLGLEHGLESGTVIRLEAYHKSLSRLRPRYVNLRDGAVSNIRFAEIEEDRIRVEPASGASRGIELLVKRHDRKRFNWWVSYSLSKVVDRVGGVTAPDHFDGQLPVDEIIGSDVPRALDQRHALAGDLIFVPNRRWSVGVAWQYHTGWPYTSVTRRHTTDPNGSPYTDFDIGPVNGERATPYHRLDMRISRHVGLQRSGLSFYVEFLNLYAKNNLRREIRQVEAGPSGDVEIGTGRQHWVKTLIPSLGLSWEIGH